MPGPLLRLELENFRAFRGDSLKLNVEGKNLLIFGENGSGKTSLWEALEATLSAVLAADETESCALFAPHRFQWAPYEEDAVVRIALSDVESGEKIYLWSAEDTPMKEEVFQAAARTRATLDYRALWETYFVQRKNQQVDVWPLLLNTLLPHFKPSSRGESLEQQWQPFSPFVDKEQRIQSKLAVDLKKRHEAFVARVTRMLDEVKSASLPILKQLSPDLSFDWTIEMQELAQVEGTKQFWRLPTPRVWLRVWLGEREEEFRNHHNLLNEARLSSLAIAIYLGAAKINEIQSEATWKLLAMDDVLIGLDMAHRMPMLDVLEDHFADWQIILSTYDRAWYELAALRLKKANWKKFEFYASADVPVWCESKDALAKSSSFLGTAHALLVPDYKAAAVYARSAFEWMMKWFCDKYGLPVTYDLEGLQKSEMFWQTVQSVYLEQHTGGAPTKTDLIPQTLKEKVERDRKIILNPLSHASLVPIYSTEVQDAIETVSELHQALHPENAFEGRIKTTLVSEEHIDFKMCSQAKLNAIFHQAQKEIEARRS